MIFYIINECGIGFNKQAKIKVKKCTNVIIGASGYDPHCHCEPARTPVC